MKKYIWTNEKPDKPCLFISYHKSDYIDEYHLWELIYDINENRLALFDDDGDEYDNYENFKADGYLVIDKYFIINNKFINKCKSCGAEIYFLKTKNGKFMPVNGSSLTENEISNLMAGKSICFDYNKHKSHFSSCPDAGKYRNKP